MCCSKTSGEDAARSAGQDETGLRNYSKPNQIVKGANHRAFKFLNRNEFLLSPGIFKLLLHDFDMRHHVLLST